MEKKLLELVKQNRPIFWSIGYLNLKNLNNRSVIETFLNYGDKFSVKKMFNILGINYVAEIFYKDINQKRINYFPQVVNYFNLYFKKHVSKYPRQ